MSEKRSLNRTSPKIDQYPGLDENEKNTILFLFEALDGQTLTMDRDQDVVEGLRPFNFGVIGHVGISYRFGERHKVFAEAGGSYGFRKLQKEGAYGQNRIGAASVMFGYSYALGR